MIIHRRILLDLRRFLNSRNPDANDIDSINHRLDHFVQAFKVNHITVPFYCHVYQSCVTHRKFCVGTKAAQTSPLERDRSVGPFFLPTLSRNIQ